MERLWKWLKYWFEYLDFELIIKPHDDNILYFRYKEFTLGNLVTDKIKF